MSNWIAGIDVHERILAVVVADVAVEGEYEFERRMVGTSPAQLRALARVARRARAASGAGAVESRHPRAEELTLSFVPDPVPVVPDVVTTGDGAVDAVVAGDGTLGFEELRARVPPN